MTPRILTDGTGEMHGIGRYVTVIFPHKGQDPHVSFYPVISLVRGHIAINDEISVAGGLPIGEVHALIAELYGAYQCAVNEQKRREKENQDRNLID